MRKSAGSLNAPTKVILKFLKHAPGELDFWREAAQDLAHLSYSNQVQTLAADIKGQLYEQASKLKNPFPELLSTSLDQVDWTTVAARLIMGK